MNTTPSKTTITNPYKVGDGATVCGWTDRHAFTVIKVTAKTITLRADKATLLNGMGSDAADKLVCHPGGFVGHVEGKQRYTYAPDAGGAIRVARMVKGARRIWTKDAGEVRTDGTRAYGYVEHANFKANGETVVPGRSEFYDYNF